MTKWFLLTLYLGFMLGIGVAEGIGAFFQFFNGSVILALAGLFAWKALQKAWSGLLLVYSGLRAFFIIMGLDVLWRRGG